MTLLDDPCPPVSAQTKKKMRSLSEKERTLYAPMADMGDMLYDKDAVYISLKDNKVQHAHSCSYVSGSCACVT